MTTYTRAMLNTKALELLFMSGAGNAPEADDIQKVDQYVDGLLAELEARNIVTVPDIANIEPAHFGALAERLAMECAPAFSKPRSQEAIEAAEERLKVMTRIGVAYPLKVDPALRSGPYGYSVARWRAGT